MTAARAILDSWEQSYKPSSLVVLVPCTTREQWVALLSLVVVNLGSVGVHPGPVTSDELYDHVIPDELEAHLRMTGSSWSPMTLFGNRVNTPATAATIYELWRSLCYKEKQLT